MADAYLSPARRDLEEKLAALQQAEDRLQASSALLNERYEQASPAVRERLQADVEAAAADVNRWHAAAYASQERQPESVARRVYDEAKSVKAPELSTFQWFAQNPGFLTSQAKDSARRDQDAQADFILTRLHEQASQAKYPYSLYDDDATAEQAMQAAQYANDARAQREVRSPYLYYESQDSQLPGAASTGERLAEGVGDAMRRLGPPSSVANTALELMARPQKFSQGFRVAGQRLAEGNPYGAAMGVGQAFLAPLFPEMAPSQAELSKYAGAGGSEAIDFALDPLWYTGSGKAIDRLRYGKGVPTYLETASGQLIRRLPNSDPAQRVRQLLPAR